VCPSSLILAPGYYFTKVTAFRSSFTSASVRMDLSKSKSTCSVILSMTLEGGAGGGARGGAGSGGAGEVGGGGGR